MIFPLINDTTKIVQTYFEFANELFKFNYNQVNSCKPLSRKISGNSQVRPNKTIVDICLRRYAQEHRIQPVGNNIRKQPHAIIGLSRAKRMDTRCPRLETRTADSLIRGASTRARARC